MCPPILTEFAANVRKNRIGKIELSFFVFITMFDVLPVIFGHIDTGAAYKAVAQVCADWRRILLRSYPRLKHQLCNHLMTLLKLYPDKPWCVYRLAVNPNLSLDELFKAKYAHCAISISSHPAVTWDVIMKNPEREWDLGDVAHNPNITREIIWGNIDAPWDWFRLSSSRHITYADVKLNPHLNWNYIGLSMNPNITTRDVIENIDRGWSWSLLSECMIIDWPLVLMYPLKWSWRRMSHNQSLTLDMVESSVDNNWNWDALAHHLVTIEFVNAHPDIKWRDDLLSYNPNMTWDVILTHNRKWNIPVIAARLGLTRDSLTALPDWKYRLCDLSASLPWEIIAMNINADWNWSDVTENPYVTLEIIFAHPQFNWNWNIVATNPKLTYEDVIMHPEIPWSFDLLSCNRFGR